MTTPQERAIKIAKEITESGASSEEQYATSVILIAAGLGVAKSLISAGKITPMKGEILVGDLEGELKDLRQRLSKH